MRASQFTTEQKAEIVLAVLSGRVGMAELCREHQVSSTAVYKWRDQAVEAMTRGLAGKGPSEREAALERENVELKKMIGDYALANYALKKGVPRSTRNGRGRS